MHFFDIGNEEASSDLLVTIEKNYAKANLLREKIKRLNIESNVKVLDTVDGGDNSLVDGVKRVEKDNNFDKKFEDEVEYFLKDFMMIDGDFSKDDLLAILPSQKSHYFRKIVIRLQAEAAREIKEIYELINEEKDALRLEDYEEFKKEINKLEKKKSLLKEIMEDKVQETSITTDVQNKLILVPTSSGNIRIIDEIEHIARDYYPRFLELINSIVEGTFKGIKRFTDNDCLSGTSEVRGTMTRIVFARLDKNVYALITAFVKKTDNGKEYQEFLKNRIGEYRNIESYLKNNLASEEFMENNDFYVSELMNLLGDSEKAKTYVKGDLNV